VGTGLLAGPRRAKRAYHEAAAIGVRFLIGLWIDSGQSSEARLMVIAVGDATLGVALQSLFWFAFFIYAAIRGFAWTLRRISAARVVLTGEMALARDGPEPRPHRRIGSKTPFPCYPGIYRHFCPEVNSTWH
jgi:hypothetical protein